MPEISLADYRWLVSEQARPYLADATSSGVSLVALTKRLRAALSPERTHLVLEQVELRERARVKFSQPEKLFLQRLFCLLARRQRQFQLPASNR